MKGSERVKLSQKQKLRLRNLASYLERMPESGDVEFSRFKKSHPNNQPSFSMAHWIADADSCGTSACIAGHAYALAADDRTFARVDDHHYDEPATLILNTAREWLGLPEAVANELFMPHSDVLSWRYSESGSIRYADRITPKDAALALRTIVTESEFYDNEGGIPVDELEAVVWMHKRVPDDD